MTARETPTPPTEGANHKPRKRGIPPLGWLLLALPLGAAILMAVDAWRITSPLRIPATIAVITAGLALALLRRRLGFIWALVLAMSIPVGLLLYSFLVLGVGHPQRATILGFDFSRILPFLAIGALLTAIVLILRDKALPVWARILFLLLGAYGLSLFVVVLLKGHGFAEAFSPMGPFAGLPFFLQPSWIGVGVVLPLAVIYLLVRILPPVFKGEVRGLASLLILILLAAVPFTAAVRTKFEDRRAGRKAGLWGRYYNGRTFQSLAHSRLDRKVDFNWGHKLPVPEISRPPYWIEWVGTIRAPRDGRYEFAITADDGAQVYLNGLRVINAWKNSKGVVRRAKLKLKAGPYHVRVAMYNHSGPGRIKFAWKPPGTSKMKTVEPAVLTTRSLNRTPREAAQLGLDCLHSDAVAWQKRHRCYGCHVQTKAIMGMSIGKRNHYVVNRASLKKLHDITLGWQKKDGTYRLHGIRSIHYWVALGLAYYDRHVQKGNKKKLLSAADLVVQLQQEDGSFALEKQEPPVMQGKCQVAAYAVFTLDQAYRHTGDERYLTAIEKAVGWLKKMEPTTTQDYAFRLLAHAWAGKAGDGEARKRAVKDFLALQRDDGGWAEVSKLPSNAYATGQALYVLKVARFPIRDPRFKAGVKYLMARQDMEGFWKYQPGKDSRSHRPSRFPPTMWAAIGLAEAFGPVNVQIESPPDLTVITSATVIEAHVENLTAAPVEKMIFLAGGRTIGERTRAPYRIEWQVARTHPARARDGGDLVITALAVTTAGFKAKDRITLRIRPKLGIKIINPLAGMTVSGRVPIEARVQLADAPVKMVSFQAGKQALGQSREPVLETIYAKVWDAAKLSAGGYLLRARVEDRAGRIAEDQLRVKIGPARISARITAPLDGAILGAEQELEGQVRHQGSPVKSVEFHVDGKPLGRARLKAGSYRMALRTASLKPGAHRLSLLAINEAGDQARDMITVRAASATLMVTSAKTLFPSALLLLVDASGSMRGRIPASGGRKVRKIAQAKKVLKRFANRLPEGARVGLRVYGHDSPVRKGNCRDSRLMVPVKRIKHWYLRNMIDNIHPQGFTPIAYSLKQSLYDLPNGRGVIVLASDGEETCKGDPCGAARHIRSNYGEGIRIHVIGYDIARNRKAREQLKCIARVTGGAYFPAEKAEQFEQALHEAVKPPFKLIAAGKRGVAARGFVNGLPVVAPPGSYRLIIEVEPPVVKKLTLPANGEIKIKVNLEGKKR